MRAIALRLEGPMQSWGGPVAGDDRPTLDFPTKSGVIGLLASALGVAREDVASLVALHASVAYGVRIERPGTRGVDYHTTQDVPRVDGGIFPTVVSRRAYLYDAVFTVLLQERDGMPQSLESLQDAIRRPAFAPFLGRRSCPPSAPLLSDPGVVSGDSWLDLFGAIPQHPRATRNELFVEPPAPEGAIRELRVHGSLVGPLPRLFGDTRLLHFRLPLEAPAAANDTVDSWFDQ